ncbi:DNA-binding transcriptional regulator, XRE-family HTH domain [Eubacterium aggregans]|uniref:DNA-binding transcriptional regulator, XRE-family HTH domain n=2 Tax=Eubacterium aggregans TaxID=81409 RepID=A0A1H3X473_9FIRM|nr:helix-turn-helix transcriptional regulator [Christensenella sp.]MDD4508272.1 helix-turn-helix transcriptional regulator [Eubacteriaceae bacterium]SDZ93781.1 DNA-binding transcriptional regulator, XRE-family HTH domain [Eubacterium aggregans]
MSYFSEKLKSERQSRKFSQEYLAKKSGLGRRTIQDYEADKIAPTVKSFEKIVKGLGTTPADFLNSINKLPSSSILKEKNGWDSLTDDEKKKVLEYYTSISVESLSHVLRFDSSNSLAQIFTKKIVENGTNFIGNNLQKFRNEANLSREEFSKKCGIPTDEINKYELNKKAPTCELLGKIAKALNVDEIELIDGAIDSSKARTISSEEEYNLSKLKTYFYSASDEGQEKIVTYAEDLLKVPEYQRAPDQEEK